MRRATYSIWPADMNGHPTSGSAAWRGDCWLVVNASTMRVLFGPDTREAANAYELVLRAVEHAP